MICYCFQNNQNLEFGARNHRQLAIINHQHIFGKDFCYAHDVIH